MGLFRSRFETELYTKMHINEGSDFKSKRRTLHPFPNSRSAYWGSLKSGGHAGIPWTIRAAFHIRIDDFDINNSRKPSEVRARLSRSSVTYNKQSKEEFACPSCAIKNKRVRQTSVKISVGHFEQQRKLSPLFFDFLFPTDVQ